MSEYLYCSFAFLTIPLVLFIMYFFKYIEKKQDYQYKINSLKIKNNIIDNNKPTNIFSFIKEHLKETIFTILLIIIIIIFCFIFNVPSEIVRYIIEVLK